MRGNNTNNYVERSFGILKDSVFARMQAYNCIQVFQFITTNIERFYVLRLLSFMHRHPGHLRLAKHFYVLVKLEPVLVQLACMTDMPCKHQGAVSVKFHILTFNFLPSLTSNDRIIYAYIALDWLCCKNNSFYASLYAVTTSQNNTTIEYDVLSCKESNENVKIVDISAFTDFLKEVRRDYRNGGTQLRTALDKFMERYEAAKLKSIPRLTSFIYDLNHDLDSMVNLRSGSMIRIQVESVK
ncbi:unnamed protein product [Rhizophagus irregularis]|nr:unnamed protein product [Rhizophagus irregularis]